jgi:hypothetical protein
MFKFSILSLKKWGFEPVVLTRGYGKKNPKKAVWLVPGSKKNFSGEICGDEALEIFFRTRAPVLVGAKRFENALLYLRGLDPEKKVVFVLDDGFQHWQLARDFDLVLVRDEDLVGDLLPLGNLREKPAALKRADLLLELGKDFSKQTFFKKSPPADKPLIVLTTRAPDPDYKRYFQSHFKNPYFVELRDHAGLREIEKSLLVFSPETPICVGAKEATKIFSYGELNHFFEEGFGKKMLGGPHIRELYFADFNLWMFDAEIIQKRLVRILESQKHVSQR